MIISIILLFFSFINIYLFNKEKRKSLAFRSWSQYFFSLFILISFIFIVIFFIRILGFFRDQKIIDLKYIFFNYSLVSILIFFIFLFTLRRLIFFFAKISFFKLHYFYLAPENNDYYELYYRFYIGIIHKSCVRSYKYFYWLDKLMLFLLFFFFFRDVLFFNLILNDTLYFMKYYSLFKLFYIILRFISEKQELMLDYYLFNLYYQASVSLDEGFFAETLSKRAHEIDEYEEKIIKNY